MIQKASTISAQKISTQRKASQTKKIGSQARGEERRGIILKTTLEMIAEGGVDSVTHRRVAERAGIPLGSTTYYFDSREHLLREAFNLYISNTRHALDAHLEAFPIESTEDFVKGMTNWISREFADQAMLQAEYEMVLYAARDQEIAELLDDWDQAMRDSLTTHLARLGAAQPTVLAEIVLNFLRGFEVTGLSKPARGQKRGLKACLELLVSNATGKA
ncbi:MAG: TetR family transcriptional regulator [Pseudomonadota bacterium]